MRVCIYIKPIFTRGGGGAENTTITQSPLTHPSNTSNIIKQDADGKESAHTVDAMVAKDRERVALYQPFTMQGMRRGCINIYVCIYLDLGLKDGGCMNGCVYI